MWAVALPSAAMRMPDARWSIVARYCEKRLPELLTAQTYFLQKYVVVFQKAYLSHNRNAAVTRSEYTMDLSHLLLAGISLYVRGNVPFWHMSFQQLWTNNDYLTVTPE